MVQLRLKLPDETNIILFNFISLIPGDFNAHLKSQEHLAVELVQLISMTSFAKHVSLDSVYNFL